MYSERTIEVGQQAFEQLCGNPDESLFQSHFEKLPGPAYIWRRFGDDFRLIAYNKMAGSLVESKASDFIGGSAKSLQGHYTDFVPRLHECLDGAKVIRYERDHCYRSGIEKRIIVTLIPVTSDVLVQHTEDITARHQADQALRASEARSRALMEANPDMLTRVSRDGRYLDVHRPDKVGRSMPLPAEQDVGSNVRDLFEPEFARTHERYRIAAIDTGEMQLWQFARMAGGRMRYIDARFVRSGDDEVVIAMTDVTDRVDLEREVVNTVERERNHIGHDLHDGVGQLLTGAKLMLEPLKKRLASADTQDSKTLQQVVDLINLAIAQTSDLARGLSPVPRDGGFTLANALDQLARRTAAFFGISCRVVERDDARGLSEECSNNLYKIAQEAITNAVKHGKATEVELSFCIADGRIKLAIQDNGKGLSESKSNVRGMGMHIMQYRARSIGGEATITSRAGGGVSVSCSCPVPLPGIEASQRL